MPAREPGEAARKTYGITGRGFIEVSSASAPTATHRLYDTTISFALKLEVVEAGDVSRVVAASRRHTATTDAMLRRHRPAFAEDARCDVDMHISATFARAVESAALALGPTLSSILYENRFHDNTTAHAAASPTRAANARARRVGFMPHDDFS